MARPTTRDELLDRASVEYDLLHRMVDGLDPARREAEFPFEDRDRRVRDVIGHLRAWQEMMLGWYEEGMAGGRPVMPAPGYTWSTTAALNEEIWRSMQDSSLESERSRLAATQTRIMAVVEAHTDVELFTKRYYPWTGSTSLGAYLVSATSSHFTWARTKLRKAIRGWGEG